MAEEHSAGAGDVVVVDPPHVVVCKGKRSKRQRVHAAPAMVITASAADVVESSSSDQEAASGCVTEEEEDMALCLMLLARGGGRAGSSSLAVVAPDAAESTASVARKEGKFRSRRPADGAGDGEFVYECKTCGRCFPSFQALGGHRTSHKKPRLLLPPTTTPTTTTTEEKKQRPALAEEKPQTPSPGPTDDPIVIAIPAVPATPPKQESATATSGARQPQQHKLGSSRVHECSICGAEFASGQALGGHMRRHRPLVPASAASSDDDVGAAAAVIGGKEKSLLLGLDLNMPAPCDDATSLPSPAAILFRGAPASALMDCHY